MRIWVPWLKVIVAIGARIMSEPELSPAMNVVSYVVVFAIVGIPLAGCAMMVRGCASLLSTPAPKQAATRPQKTRDELRDQYGPALRGVDGRAIWRALLGSGWACRGQTAEGWSVFADRRRGSQTENISWYGVDDSEICSLSGSSLGVDQATARQTLTYLANLIAGETAADWVATNWAYGGEITQPGVHLRLHRTSTASTLTISAAP